MHARPLSSPQAHHHISRRPGRRDLSSASGPEAEDDGHQDVRERPAQAGDDDQDPGEDYSALEEIVSALGLRWWAGDVDRVSFSGLGVGEGRAASMHVFFSRRALRRLRGSRDRDVSLSGERTEGAFGRTHLGESL